MKYADEFMREGGNWLGSLRTRFQTMFIRGNGESIIWGSNEEVRPCPTMKQIEELGSYAVAGYHREKVEPMLELLVEMRNRLREEYGDTGREENDKRKEIEKTLNKLSSIIDGKPEWMCNPEVLAVSVWQERNGK